MGRKIFNKKEIVKQVLLENEKGLTNRAIAKKFGIDGKTVGTWLEKNKKLSAFKLGKTPHQGPNFIAIDKIKCKACNKTLPLDRFSIQKERKLPTNHPYPEIKFYYRSHCIGCEYQRDKKRYAKDPIGYFGQRISTLKSRSSNLNITPEYLLSLYKKQNGRCFYTGKKLKLKVSSIKDWEKLSIDKIIPENGYIIGNVVLCTNKFNTVKQNLSLKEIKKFFHPDIYNKIMAFLNETTN